MEQSSFLNPGAALASAGIHEGMQVADLGTGSGFFARAAARAVGPQGAVWAIDAQADLLPRLKNLALEEGHKNIEVLRGDAGVPGGTQLPENAFDLAILANLLFTIEDKHECVAEVRRILKRGGHALVIDWTDSHGGLGPHPGHVVTRAAAEKLFESQNFAIARMVPAGAYHWGFLARKK